MQRANRCTLAKKGASGGKTGKKQRETRCALAKKGGRRSALLSEGDGAGIIGAGGEGGSIG